jgi:hypothetical protein
MKTEQPVRTISTLVGGPGGAAWDLKQSAAGVRGLNRTGREAGRECRASEVLRHQVAEDLPISARLAQATPEPADWCREAFIGPRDACPAIHGARRTRPSADVAGKFRVLVDGRCVLPVCSSRQRAWEVSPLRASETDQDAPAKRFGLVLIDTSHLAGLPGMHDLGALLGVTAGFLLLVILRAAERWVPDDDRLGEKSANRTPRGSCSCRAR